MAHAGLSEGCEKSKHRKCERVLERMIEDEKEHLNMLKDLRKDVLCWIGLSAQQITAIRKIGDHASEGFPFIVKRGIVHLVQYRGQFISHRQIGRLRHGSPHDEEVPEIMDHHRTAVHDIYSASFQRKLADLAALADQGEELPFLLCSAPCVLPDGGEPLVDIQGKTIQHRDALREEAADVLGHPSDLSLRLPAIEESICPAPLFHGITYRIAVYVIENI
jgi:hypothetical protein